MGHEYDGMAGLLLIVAIIGIAYRILRRGPVINIGAEDVPTEVEDAPIEQVTLEDAREAAKSKNDGPKATIVQGKARLILVAIVIVLAIVTLPTFSIHFYRLGMGHAFSEIATSKNLPWDAMAGKQRAPYIALAESEGMKCAVLMTFGLHIPIVLLSLIVIGLLTPSLPQSSRKMLQMSFLGVSIIGVGFFSLGAGYWGQAKPFLDSLGPAIVIYLVIVCFFGILLKVSEHFLRQGK